MQQPVARIQLTDAARDKVRELLSPLRPTRSRPRHFSRDALNDDFFVDLEGAMLAWDAPPTEIQPPGRPPGKPFLLAEGIASFLFDHPERKRPEPTSSENPFWYAVTGVITIALAAAGEDPQKWEARDYRRSAQRRVEAEGAVSLGELHGCERRALRNAGEGDKLANWLDDYRRNQDKGRGRDKRLRPSKGSRCK